MIAARLLSLALVVWVAGALPGAARSADILSSDARIRASFSEISFDPPFSDGGREEAEATDVRSFDESVQVPFARANLQIALTPSQLDLEGRVSSSEFFDGDTSAGGTGIAQYDLGFSVASDTPYSFAIRMDLDEPLFPNSPTRPTIIELLDSTGAAIFRHDISDTIFLVIDVVETGVLGPGNYTFRLDAESGDGATSFRVNAVIPEPGTALLLLPGLAGLALQRRAGRL